MRIAILGDTLKEPLTGIGHYTRELVLSLRRTFPSNEYVLVRPRNDAYAKVGQPVAEIDFPDPGPSSRWRQFRWQAVTAPRWAARQGFDLVHGPGNLKSFLGPWGRRRTKRVLTIHDLTPLVVPQTHRRRRTLEFQFLTRAAVRASDGILTDSHASMRDLERLIPEARQASRRVVHLGLDPRYLDYPRQRQARDPQVPDEYFIHVGTVEPRKNHRALVAAFAQYARRGGTADLVCIGASGWKNTFLREVVASSGVASRIHFLGYVDLARLPNLYGHARALVYPSVYEGFGFPVIEAMATGCPVVASNVSSVPEVAGPAAILVGPDDVDAIATHMLRLDRDEDLRKEWVRRGLLHAAAFTWERVARQTQAFFDEVVGAPRVP